MIVHLISGELGQSANKKKRPRRPCIFCGKYATRLTDHIRGIHKNEPSVKAAMALPKKEQMERFIQLKKDGIFQGETQITQNCLSNGNRKKPTRSTEKRGMLFYVQGVLLQRSNKKPDYSKLIKERKQHIWHKFHRKMWFVVPCVWGSNWVSALIYKHKKRYINIRQWIAS